MKKIRINTLTTLTVAFIAVLLLAFLACSNEKGKGPERIKVGVILPLTGDAATYGENCKKGMLIASEKYSIPLIFEDSAVDAKKAVNAFNKLVNVDKAIVVLGDMFSSTTLAFAPIAETKKVLVISPTAGSEDVPKTGKYIFSLYPSATIEGAYMAEKLLELRHNVPLSIGIMHTQEQVYTDIASGFKTTLRNEPNATVVFVEAIPPARKDFKDIISKFMRKPEINTMYLSGDKIFVSNFIKQAKQLKWSVDFISQSTLYDTTLIEKYGDYLSNVIFTGPYFDIDNEDELTKKFVSLFREKYNTDPDVWAAYGYDTVLIIQKALEICKNCYSSELINTVAKLQIRGVTGPIRFNNFGGSIRSFKIFTVSNGKFKIVH